MPKVLVADDSITVRKVAERLLTEAGMEVALAASGEEAMAYLFDRTSRLRDLGCHYARQERL